MTMSEDNWCFQDDSSDDIIADAAKEFVRARTEFEEFERENPNNFANEWDRLFLAADTTYAHLKQCVDELA